jgi:exopolysaccharide biosynthesis polyprenyl glycosylphosphotransferase
VTSSLDQVDATQTSHSRMQQPPAAETAATGEETLVPRSTASIPTPPPIDNWRQRYARRIWTTDLLALVWVVYGTQIAWFGLGNVEVAMRADSRITEFSYWIFSAGLIGAWMFALSLSDSRSHRFMGAGNIEYARIIDASFRLFGLIAIGAFLFRIDVARGFLLIGLPAGILILLAVRWLWRQWLISQRARGGYSARVLLVGSESSVAEIARELVRTPHAGYRVVGACVPSGRIASTIQGTDIPIMGSVNAVERAIATTGADTVAVTSTDELPPQKVKQISWGLEAGRQHLVLAPSIIDVAGPRIHMRPVAGLPLIHVETPRFSRGQRVLKRTMDLIVSAAGIIAISPLLFVLALTVRLSSRGPVLFRQTRVGLSGREFTMLKFRSMVDDAEAQLENVPREGNGPGNEVLFKARNDPRVTRVGRVMRKFSLDELPQLINVLQGSMSLVGPRPPLPREVAMYANHVHRRFLVKPGITGLWQVSGRSLLSWEDTVRLDLSYVENWTFFGDVSILARTARAALAPGDSAH